MSAFVWTDARVRAALGLRADRAREGVEFTGISTDSRTVEPGNLYVALVGDRFDGHDFVADAFARGALGAVVSAPVPGEPGGSLYPVQDTLSALGSLAAHFRNTLEIPVVAITGSAGKTTTKDFTRGALSQSLRVHATRGNLNNRVGMPLTLLSTPADAQAVVLELGTNEPGEIRLLARIATPDIAVVTTVGASHLEKLETVAGVMKEKLSLFAHVAEGGVCVTGDTPPELPVEARRVCPHLVVAGEAEEADERFRARHVESDMWGTYSFVWRGQRVTLPVAGRHMVLDAVLALTVADTVGIAARDAVRGIRSADFGAMRGESRRVGGLTVIVDCYNANPVSVKAALDLLGAHSGGSGRVVVLGSMLELGAASDALHEEVLDDALSRGFDRVVATGEFARVAGDRAHPALMTAPTWNEAYPSLRGVLTGDEVVLLKASRGVAMEGILPLLESDFGEEAA
ncbi:MAG: UDP-N-acetylmuramoyl-tripeptide--D-alanyl-D-alanine ligase [Gemmatimonadota bacterium]|nr:UDP-N-acetylmuramoyl-tripeptide--D-alanyl-D-alanine ligase [Gemmatimonadota bacterium]